MNLKYILIVVILVAFVGGGILTYQYWLALKEEIKLSEVKPPEKVTINETANWNNYTYKNLSFQYPKDWIVVFDSTVYGQPNGFDLHVMNQNDGGYAPDALYLSTYNSFADTSDGGNYRVSQNRVFSNKNQNSNDRIQFTTSGTTIYAACDFYSKGQTTLDICNKIVSTIVIK